MNGLILSLCDHTGAWSRPYADSGYEVVRIDLQDGRDVRTMRHLGRPVRGILMAPPCTDFALSGARHWEAKGEPRLLEGLAIVDACLRTVAIYRPEWWALENPVGRLRDYLGPPAFRFDPCDFAGMGDTDSEAYTKRTCLWGNFTPPSPLFIGGDRSVEPVLGSKMHRLAPGPGRAAIRSITPDGFARAFFLCNP